MIIKLTLLLKKNTLKCIIKSSIKKEEKIKITGGLLYFKINVNNIKKVLCFVHFL